MNPPIGCLSFVYPVHNKAALHVKYIYTNFMQKNCIFLQKNV